MQPATKKERKPIPVVSGLRNANTPYPPITSQLVIIRSLWMLCVMRFIQLSLFLKYVKYFLKDNL